MGSINTAAEQGQLLDAADRFNRAGNAVRLIAWALAAMATAGLSVAGWVWTVDRTQKDHDAAIKDFRPRVEALETRAVRIDAAQPPTREQLFELDKRLERMEQNAATVKEQNAMIIYELRSLQGKN